MSASGNASEQKNFKNQDGRDARFKKTQLCVFFREGRCRLNGACTFAHDPSELESTPNLSKTALCNRWKNGKCPHSSEACRYAHGFHDMRSKTDRFKGQCVQQDPARAKLGNRPRPRLPATTKDIADPWKVPEPMNVAPLEFNSEPMMVTPMFLGTSSPCLSAKTSSLKSMQTSQWSQWDNDTAVGETSSEDEECCSLPTLESDEDLSKIMTSTDVGAPPGLYDVRTDVSMPPGFYDAAVLALTRRMLGLALKPPPGLAEC